MYKDGGGAPFGFYGRVVRVLDPETVLWICCGKDIHVTKIEHLIVLDYDGKWEWTGYRNEAGEPIIRYFARGADNWHDFDKIKYERPTRFIYMPTLRKLKQRASRYANQNAWKTPLDYEYIQRKERG